MYAEQLYPRVSGRRTLRLLVALLQDCCTTGAWALLPPLAAKVKELADYSGSGPYLLLHQAMSDPAGPEQLREQVVRCATAAICKAAELLPGRGISGSGQAMCGSDAAAVGGTGTRPQAAAIAAGISAGGAAGAVSSSHSREVAAGLAAAAVLLDEFYDACAMQCQRQLDRLRSSAVTSLWHSWCAAQGEARSGITSLLHAMRFGIAPLLEVHPGAKDKLQEVRGCACAWPSVSAQSMTWTIGCLRRPWCHLLRCILCLSRAHGGWPAVMLWTCVLHACHGSCSCWVLGWQDLHGLTLSSAMPAVSAPGNLQMYAPSIGAMHAICNCERDPAVAQAMRPRHHSADHPIPQQPATGPHPPVLPHLQAYNAAKGQQAPGQAAAQAQEVQQLRELLDALARPAFDCELMLPDMQPEPTPQQRSGPKRAKCPAKCPAKAVKQLYRPASCTGLPGRSRRRCWRRSMRSGEGMCSAVSRRKQAGLLPLWHALIHGTPVWHVAMASDTPANLVTPWP